MPDIAMPYYADVDVHVRSDYPTSAYNNAYLQISYTSTVRYALLHFSHNITRHAYVVSASLRITGYSGGAATVRANRLTSAFAVGTTYNTRPSWTANGESPAVSVATGTYTLDVTNIVRSWVHDGTTNYGIVLLATAGPNVYIRSNEHTVAGERPLLTIVYHDPAFDVKVNGAWKYVVASFVNINGTWRRVTGTYAKINGVWRQG